MNRRIICKDLTVTVILLFIGVGIQSAIATGEPQNIDVEPKDYLFQTIIDIDNNPDVKELLEQCYNDLFKVDIDRNVYRKLLLSNPRLLFNILFTKPSITYDYLDKCYNNGIEVTNILGEDKAFEIIDSIDIPDTKVFDEINNIITNDEELSGRLVILEEMNKELNSIDYPIICGILLLVTLVVMIPINIVLSFLGYSYIFFKKILKLIGIDALFLQMGFLLLYISFILFVLTVNFCILIVSP